MGAWGYGLLDNDGVLDELHDVQVAVVKKLQKLFKKSNPEHAQDRFERLGVLHAVLPLKDINYHVEETDIVDKALSDIDSLVQDQSWLKSWRDGGRGVKRNLRHLKTKLSKINP